MRCFSVSSIVGALALMLCAGLSLAAEKNPSAAYDSWAKVKVGSSITQKLVTDARGQKIEMEITYTLAEIQPEKVILDVKQSMVAAGRSIDMPARKQDVLKSGVSTGPQTRGPKQPDADIKESEATLKIGDKEYKCHVVEGTSSTNGGKATVKTWMCSDVPNVILKMETTMEGATAGKTSMEVTKIDVK